VKERAKNSAPFGALLACLSRALAGLSLARCSGALFFFTAHQEGGEEKKHVLHIHCVKRFRKNSNNILEREKT